MSSILNQDKRDLIDLIPDKVYLVARENGKIIMIDLFYSEEAANDYISKSEYNCKLCCSLVHKEKFKVS